METRVCNSIDQEQFTFNLQQKTGVIFLNVVLSALGSRGSEHEGKLIRTMGQIPSDQ